MSGRFVCLYLFVDWGEAKDLLTLVKAFTMVPPMNKPLVEFLYKRLGENLALLSTSVMRTELVQFVGTVISTMDNRVPPQ